MNRGEVEVHSCPGCAGFVGGHLVDGRAGFKSRVQLEEGLKSGGLSLRIAFVDQDLCQRTGSRRFTCEVARELRSRGHEVRIFTSNFDGDKCFGGFLSLPVEVIGSGGSLGGRVPSGLRRAVRRCGKSSVFTVAKSWGYDVRQTRFALGVSQRLAEMGCDAAMVHYHGEHWLAPYFYSLSGSGGAVYLNMVPPRPRPFALPFQESSLERRVADALVSLPPVGVWEEASLRRVGLFVTPSEFQLRQARLQGLVGGRRTAVVPLGVNHGEFRSTGEEEPFALYVGRLHPHKSLELAVASMGKTGRDYSLVIAGFVDEGNVSYKDRLLGLAEKLKIADRVRLVLNPSDREVVRLMQRCSVFLFPSTIDTFGLVVLEAMACGKPVVACNRGGVPEVVGDAGFLLEPDVGQWQKTVVRVLSERQVRRQVGEKALERSKSFSWEKTTDRLIRCFD